MLNLLFTNQYKKDQKKCRKRNKDFQKLKEVLEYLVDEKKLPVKYRDHKLSGNYKDHNECHIEPDWLLIYKVDQIHKDLILVRTGTHSDLFE